MLADASTADTKNLLYPTKINICSIPLEKKWLWGFQGAGILLLAPEETGLAAG